MIGVDHFSGRGGFQGDFYPLKNLSRPGLLSRRLTTCMNGQTVVIVGR